MRYCKDSRLVVANEMFVSLICGNGGSIRKNDFERKTQPPSGPATSKSAPFAHSSASRLSSSPSLLSSRREELAKTRSRTVSKLVRDALSTVASILRRKPRSLTQKNATNDKARTAK